MKDYAIALRELTEAFRHLQNARDACSSDPALKSNFENSLAFIAVLIAETSDKLKALTART